MPSNTLDDLLPSAIAAHSRAIDYLGTQTVFYRTVVVGILTAITTGLMTATVAIGSTTSKDLQWVMEELRKNGYTVAISTTNLVITWSL